MGVVHLFLDGCVHVTPRGIEPPVFVFDKNLAI